VPTLLGVPNLSEGRDLERVHRLVDTFLDPAALLDFHFDQVHNRTAVTIAGEPEPLRASLESGARAAVAEIDMTAHEGEHPCIGAVDVCPIVYLREEDRGAAQHEAAEVGRWIGDELEVPVFLYGDLAATEERRERAYFREGGPERLADRMEAEELAPDFGPTRAHPTAGGTLVTARPPLAAFNVFLDSPDPRLARLVAAGLRESGGGLPGVRAIGLSFEGVTQVSTNVHDPVAVPLGLVVEEVRRLARPLGAHSSSAEIVGLVPEAALRDFPEDVAFLDPDVNSHVLEHRLAALEH
jgi:glutamate formiminotransferase / 5-formyltetrahydrofolate cyclo-ligase